MEFKASIISCPNGHYYDPTKYSSCPICSGVMATPETSAPESATAVNWSMNETQAPNNDEPIEATGAYTPFDVPTVGPEGIQEDGRSEPVVGWLVCTHGAHRGSDYRIRPGYNYIGREIGDIQIHGDNRVSRQKHAMIAFDSDSLLYFFGPMEGRSLVSLNGTPVLNAQQIHSYDTITIGASKFLFMGLCGEQFQWKPEEQEDKE